MAKPRDRNLHSDSIWRPADGLEADRPLAARAQAPQPPGARQPRRTPAGLPEARTWLCSRTRSRNHGHAQRTQETPARTFQKPARLRPACSPLWQPWQTPSCATSSRPARPQPSVPHGPHKRAQAQDRVGPAPAYLSATASARWPSGAAAPPATPRSGVSPSLEPSGTFQTLRLQTRGQRRERTGRSFSGRSY